MKAIVEKWPIFAGKIRIQVLGDGSLPKDLQVIVDATGSDSWIEGEDLVDLCKQRSEEGESGCNSPGAFEEPLVALASGCDPAAAIEEPPVPLASPPANSVMPVVQVRRYSWRSYAKHNTYEKRRDFVGTNKQINTNSLLFSPQEPLVSRVHLMKVVRKIGQQERSRGRSLTVDKFNAYCSKGGKNVTSSSHSNREDEGDKAVINSGNIGMSKNSYKYPGINDKYNSKVTGKQERGREEKLRLPGSLNGKGKVTSWIHDITIEEQHGKLSLDKLVARQYKQIQVCLRSSAKIGYEKVVQGYNKMIAIIAFYFMVLTQILEGCTHFILCELEINVGNSGKVSEDEGMRRCQLSSFYTILVCLSKIWKYKHRLWLLLIIDGLWRRDKVSKNKDKGIYQLTFRLVVARPWLRNLLLGNVCKRNVSVRIGNTGNTFMAGKVIRAYLCPCSDLWASCRVYLCKDAEILALYYKIKSFCAFIYLYIRKFLRFWLSCKWASFPLAFAVKLPTLVYFASKASLLMIKSYKKYQSINLIGLAPWKKAYAKYRPFLSHNGPDWRELRPLVTPWTWPIKEGIEPWKSQTGLSCLMSKVSLLPFSLSSPSLALALVVVLLLFCYGYVLVKGKNSNKY